MHTQFWQMRLVMSLLVVLSALLGLPRHSPAHVGEFTCAAGDVACLIDAINQANANREANTITLEAGTYTLTAVGLPSVTGVVTIQGAGLIRPSWNGRPALQLSASWAWRQPVPSRWRG
jgi:hypothetical protein